MTENVVVCPCGQKIVFVREETEDGEGKLHPLDISSPVYEVKVNTDGSIQAVKANRVIPTDPFYDSAYMVSHFRTCRKVDEFRKVKKELER